MNFVTWLRGVVDLWTRTPYVRMLEQQILDEREWCDEMLADAKQAAAIQRADLVERIRDKDGVINDLRIRLAAAETDTMREKLAKQPQVVKPVPDFGGPVPFQDELARMSLEVEEVPKENDNAVS